jgi:hypothetical protein
MQQSLDRLEPGAHRLLEIRVVERDAERPPGHRQLTR